ncbi:MAG: metallophosphoesterase [Neobacillus sp.]
MKRIKYRNWTVSLVTLLVLINYTFYDNNQIKLTKQVVEIDQLSKDLDGFTILQITDLHEKEFGKKQTKLVNKINSIHYDAIVFTGDMLKNNTSNNFDPFYDLLEGIDNKEIALFVPGNTDPEMGIKSENPLIKSDFITGMELRGVKFLESLVTIENSNSKLHFVDFEFSLKDKEETLRKLKEKSMDESSQIVSYQEQLFEEISTHEQIEKSDVLIGLTHYPVVDQRIDYLIADSTNHFLNYDLLIAGHYHGGQFRIPFIGALFIPEGWYPRDGLFPPQDRVKGLWKYRNIKQYVSTGLGSSDAIPFLKFRLFNTPEINLLTLKEGE